MVPRLMKPKYRLSSRPTSAPPLNPSAAFSAPFHESAHTRSVDAQSCPTMISQKTGASLIAPVAVPALAAKKSPSNGT